MTYASYFAIPYCVVVFILPSPVNNLQWDEALDDGQNEINKEWIHPDEMFMIQSQQTESTADNCEECRKSLSEWLQKFAECQKSLQRISSAQEPNEKESFVMTLADKSSAQCSREGSRPEAYLRRFVLLFLDVIALQTGEVNTYHDVDLKLSISGEHLLILRQFAKEDNLESVPPRKVDEVFTAIFVKRYFYVPTLSDIISVFFSFKNGIFFFSIVIPILIFFLMLLWTRRLWISVASFLAVVFIVSYFTTAAKMYKEASIKQYEIISRSSDIPSDCKYVGRTWSELWLGSSKSHCFEYYKAHNMDSNLEVSPLKVLSRMFGETMSDVFAHFGDSLREFLSKFENFGIFQKAWVIPTACVLMLAFVGLIFLFLSGGSISLPFFLGGVHFYNPQRRGTLFDSGRSRVTGLSNNAASPSTITSLPANNQLPSNVEIIWPHTSQNASNFIVSSPALVRGVSASPIPKSSLDTSAAAFSCKLEAGDSHSIGNTHPSEGSDTVFQFKAQSGSNDSNNRYLKQLQTRHRAVYKSSTKSTFRDRHNSL